MQDHHLNLCIIFIIIIIFIAPSHKEYSIVMAYRSLKTSLIFFCLFGTLSFFLVLFFFVMYCLTLIHRYMVQKENIKLTNVKLHCLNCKLFVD